jgi:dienelactone hydrolase
VSNGTQDVTTTLWQYYTNLAEEMARRALSDLGSAAQWEQGRAELRRQFLRSMGLAPLPARCDLKLTDWGSFEGRGYRARKIAFQILPDCWATAVVYGADPLPAPRCPGVLYLCGHGGSGAADYQVHAMRWARRGYVCLVLDTIEQHDNPGEHHGLWSGLRPDWISLGYTAAGGEIWNSLRALDVLAALPEVDPARLGATGVSGGGVMSFYAAIADERIRAVASSCGVSVPCDALRRRHLLNHCDCIYYHNLHGRDPSEFGALIAPRPALFYYSAQDILFSPEESRAMVNRIRRVYRLLGCEEHCALRILPGPHGEGPEALAEVDRWFDRHVAGEEHPRVEQPADKQPESVLELFNGAPPAPDRLDLLPELLGPRGSLALPRDSGGWPGIQRQAVDTLRTEVFGRLDGLRERLRLERVSDSLSAYRDTACRKYAGEIGGMDVWVETMAPAAARASAILGVCGPGEDAGDVLSRLAAHAPADAVRAAFEPRGTGFSAAAPERRTALLRAALLVGLTPTMLMVQDLRLLMEQSVAFEELKGRALFLYGCGEAGVACIHAALFDPRVAGVILEEPPASHAQGAPIPGILRVLDLEQSVGLMAPRPVALVAAGHGWRSWAARAYARIGRTERLMVEPVLGKALERISHVGPRP